MKLTEITDPSSLKPKEVDVAVRKLAGVTDVYSSFNPSSSIGYQCSFKYHGHRTSVALIRKSGHGITFIGNIELPKSHFLYDLHSNPGELRAYDQRKQIPGDNLKTKRFGGEVDHGEQEPYIDTVEELEKKLKELIS
jgi:hypothetical protein